MRDFNTRQRGSRNLRFCVITAKVSGGTMKKSIAAIALAGISEPGVYTLTVTGATSGRTASASVTVTGTGAGTGLANTGTGTSLANTGADSSLILWSVVGAGALAAGAASVITVRRRAKANDI